MEANKRHIISSINWDTSINQKDLSGQLQQKISHWSNFHLEREVNRLFDRICPDHQQWRIPRMELDLGIIDYHDFESEINRKIPALIEEKLNEFLMQQQLYGNSDGIIEESKSKEELWESVLLKGSLPWWYDRNDWQGLNTELETELRINGKTFIHQLSQLAAKSQVRKRLAWQLEEKVLEEIVVLAEPANHLQILSFKKEVQRSQAASEELQTNRNDFTKSLWLWILNYLFEERGSFFNKVAFMQSLLHQMAAHYNLRFDSLLMIIRASAVKIKAKRRVYSEFIRILDLLTEKYIDQTEANKAISVSIIWKQVEQSLQKAAYDQLTTQYQLDDLIPYLLKEDEKRFIELLNASAGYRLNKFLKLLNEKTLIRLIELFTDRYYGPEYFNYIQRIYLRLFSTKTEKKQQLFLLKAFQYLKENKTVKTFQPADFFRSEVFTNTQRKQLVKSMLSDSKLAVELVDLQIDQDLLLWNNRLQYSPAQLANQLDRLIELIAQYPTQQSLFEELSLIIRKYPIQLIDFLRELDRERMELVLPLMLEEENFFQLIIKVKAIEEIHLNLQELLIKQKSWIPEFDRYNTIFTQLVFVQYLKSEKEFSKTFFQRVFEEMFKELIIWNKVAFVAWLEEVVKIQSLKKWKLNDLVKLTQSEVDDMLLLTSLLSRPKVDTKAVGTIALRLLQEKKLEQQQYLEIQSNFFTKAQSDKLKRLLKSWEEKLLMAKQTFGRLEVQLLLQQMVLDFEVHQGSIAKLEGYILQYIKAEGIILEEKTSEKSIKNLKPKKHKTFLSAITQYGLQAETESYDLMLLIYQSFLTFIPQQFSAQYEGFFLRAIQKLEKARTAEEKVLFKLVEEIMQLLKLQLGLNEEDIRKELATTEYYWDTRLRNRLIKIDPVFKIIYLSEQGDFLEEIKKQGFGNSILSIVQFLMLHGKLPAYLHKREEKNLIQWMTTIKESHPSIILGAFLELRELKEVSIQNLQQSISFELLAELIAILNNAERPKIQAFVQLYAAFGRINSAKYRSLELQDFLFKYLFNHWRNKTLQQTNAAKFWIELIYHFGRKYQLSKEVLVDELLEFSYLFPKVYAIQLQKIEQPKQAQATSTAINDSPDPSYFDLSSKKGISDPIPVKNAGLVILNAYVKMLFERLGYMNEEGRFQTKEKQIRAAHMLQYVATGYANTEEVDLALNKVMCGLGIDEALTNEVLVKAENKELIEGLIKAMIGYWDAIGDSSIEGFRGNWFVRDGLLTEYEDHWELVVEKRAYDLLLEQSPFTFSIINYPWMEKILKVNWPY